MSTAIDTTGTEAKAAHFAEEARKANAALGRVRAIHAPVDAVDYGRRPARQTQVCAGCGTDSGNWQTWPCPTIRALEVQ